MDCSSVSNVCTSQAQATAQNERTTLVLKKAQDAAKQQAQALIELVKAGSPDHIGQNVDFWA
jgi:hypothetical protein